MTFRFLAIHGHNHYLDADAGVSETSAQKTTCVVKVVFFRFLPPFPKEYCLLEGSQASPVCPSGESSV